MTRFAFIAVVLLCALYSSPAQCQEDLEQQLTAFVREMYGGEDIRIKFNNLPQQKKTGFHVRGIRFARVPDESGNGICLVETVGARGQQRDIMVSFRVLVKRQLYLTRHNMRSGEVIDPKELRVQHTYLSGSRADQQTVSSDDLKGKRLKKDVGSGTVLTSHLLEETVVIAKGEIVNIVAETRKLLVQTKGRVLDKGRLGDIVKVRNLSSGKEILARVVGSDKVVVDVL